MSVVVDAILPGKLPGGQKRSFADAGLTVDTNPFSNDDFPSFSLADNEASYSQKRRYSISVDSPDNGGHDSAFYSQGDMLSKTSTPNSNELSESDQLSPVEVTLLDAYQQQLENETVTFDNLIGYSSAAAIDPALAMALPYSNQILQPASQPPYNPPTLYADTMLPPNHPLATPETRRAQHSPSCTGCPVCIITTVGPLQGTVAPSSLMNSSPWSMQMPEQFTLFLSSPSFRSQGTWSGYSKGHAHPFANSPLSSTSSGSPGSRHAIYGRVRANPQIRLTPVDSSCSYVICDAKAPGTPILHCSSGFTALTGYTLPEIMGRNCQFLQTPDNVVPPFSRPRDNCVDLSSVARLRKSIANREEIQITLINYRKGGHPFVNILTIIPLRDLWGEVHQFIGLQVDVVETPEAIRDVHMDGSYTMDYRRKPASVIK